MKPFERYRRRMTCDLIVEGSRHGAIVTDLSASGLFLRTKHTSRTGDRVRIVLHEDEGEIEIDARVVREHRTSRHHTTGAPSGIGVSIMAASETYFQMLGRLMNETPRAGA